MELDFDENFKISTMALKLNRSHPYIKKDKKWALVFTLVHGIFTLGFLVVFYNIFYHDLKMKQFSQTCKNGVLFVVYVVISFQYSILLYHQELLLVIIKNMNKDYDLAKSFSSDEKEIVLNYVKKGQYVCKQWVFTAILGASVFLIKNIVLTIYYYCTDEFKKVPFYDLTYPKIIEDNKDNIYVYLFTYALMFFYDYYAAVMYLAFVPLGPIFILHACGQLELVQKKIDNLFIEIDNEVIRIKLKNIIEHLQYIHSFVDCIKTCFRVTYEITLKASTLLLPITFFEVLEAFKEGEVSLEFIAFIIGGILISGSPCLYSDLLMEKGEKVRLSLYSCGWERHYDRRTRTTLQLMLQQAISPIALQTVFRILCLDALTDLYQQSYAIFNLMNAMWS